MHYFIVGLNYKTAPVDLREKMAFSKESVEVALKQLSKVEVIDEVLILSTCNRVEIYSVSSDVEKALFRIKEFLADYHHLPLEAFEPYLYVYYDVEAVKHLFRVTASLDSMVVGEPQIVGQVKLAYQQAMQAHTSGVMLNRCLERSLFVSKKIRTETKIAAKSVSVGGAAVHLAKQIFGDLHSKKVALIGTGKIGELVSDYLEAEGVAEMILLNRTYEKAEALTREVMGAHCRLIAMPMDKLEEALSQVDLAISSAGGASPLITVEQISRLMPQRRHQPIFFIDLGVPRNIEAGVNDIENAYLYNIDDLQKVVNSHKGERQEEAVQGALLAEKEAVQFYESVIHERPTLALLGKKFEAIRSQELNRTLAKLSHLPEEERTAIEKCTQAIVSKILFDPAIGLKAGETHRPHWSAHDLLKKLFRLDDE